MVLSNTESETEPILKIEEFCQSKLTILVEKLKKTDCNSEFHKRHLKLICLSLRNLTKYINSEIT